LTVREAARLLGVPEGTAKTRLMRARARLRELLT
jgi:RNA polymerase sigma-70 factor (ECF subfamily)